MLSLCILYSFSNSSKMFMHPSQFSEHFCQTLFLQTPSPHWPPHRALPEEQPESCQGFFLLFVSLPFALERTQIKGKQLWTALPNIKKKIFERASCCAVLTFCTKFMFKTAYKFLNFYTNVLRKSPLNLVDYSSAVPFKPLGIYTTLLGFKKRIMLSV